jgi:hypothetical protein
MYSGVFLVACAGIRHITNNEKHLKRKNYGTACSIFLAGGKAAAGGVLRWPAGAGGQGARSARGECEGAGGADAGYLELGV